MADPEDPFLARWSRRKRDTRRDRPAFALGADSDLIRDVQALSGPKPLPPDPFLGLGVKARLRWYHWRNRAEW